MIRGDEYSFYLDTAMMLVIFNFHLPGDSSALVLLTERDDQDGMHIFVISTLIMVGDVYLVSLP